MSIGPDREEMNKYVTRRPDGRANEPTVFGLRLAKLRTARGLTQEQLGALAVIPPVMISHYECGVRQYASAENLIKIANALQTRTDWLLGRTNADAPFPTHSATRRELFLSHDEEELIIGLRRVVDERIQNAR